ncbi:MULTISPECIES: hypothetical protein [Escherichia]|nr:MULTISPECIES: hypothetical protein [Escherichia]ELW5342203.1 hypothetical protein [Escherichia coli]MBY0699606.1 hypothetical protein [Escherichia sp. NT45]MCI4484644.1 hypothetical protein [Escherichia coli]MCI4514153.1 hypothetical protein [Escherichia coli]MCI4514319.1 hypothetical protein [Escherichia coli]
MMKLLIIVVLLVIS